MSAFFASVLKSGILNGAGISVRRATRIPTTKYRRTVRCIAVDATAVTARPTGAGRVVRNLLAALPAADPGNRYVALATEEGARALNESGPGLRVRVVTPGRSLVWELSGAARAADESGADLLFTVRELVGRRSP